MQRLALAIPAALLALNLHGQAKPSAAIPATSPTQNVSDLPSARPAMSTPAGEASIVWDGSLLTIHARGDSLRNVLRAVSQATGMKISGGVPEETVFGTYGPGSAQAVLPQLFDGISVNMMLVNSSAQRPGELLLTQRNGAASPPQVRPISDEDQGFRRRQNGRGPQVNGISLAPPMAPRPTPSDPSAPPQPMEPNSENLGTNTATPQATTDANGQPASPNGVRTPEQIFEELRKRQQQQQSPTPQ